MNNFNSKKSKFSPLFTSIAVGAGIIIGFLIFYFFFGRTARVTYTDTGSNISIGTSTDTAMGNSDASSSALVTVTPTPSVSAIPSTNTSGSSNDSSNTSDWPVWSNYELGFSVSYPPDVTVNTSNPSVFNLTFPSSYFSTAMIDTDSFSVAVLPTCPSVFSSNAALISGDASSSQDVVENGITFVKSYQLNQGEIGSAGAVGITDAATGTHTAITTYDTQANSVCYHIIYTSQGANDASAYGIDPSKIPGVNASHAIDAKRIDTIVDSMIASFAFVNTPSGQNEATVGAQDMQAGTQTGTQNSASVISTSSSNQSASLGNGNASSEAVSVNTISPSTVSVGQDISITGQGFSGSGTVVWISNGNTKGVLWGGTQANDSLITEPVPAQACTTDTSVSGGAPCSSYLVVSPGVYELTVSSASGTSDPVYIKVQ